MRPGCDPVRQIRQIRQISMLPPIVGLRPRTRANIFPGTREHVAALLPARKFMIAVIGNMIAGLGVFSLFTATLRLSKPGKRS